MCAGNVSSSRPATATESTSGWIASARSAAAREPVVAASIIARSTALTALTRPSGVVGQRVDR